MKPTPWLPGLRAMQGAPLLGGAGAARASTLGIVFALLGASLFSTKAILIKLAYKEAETGGGSGGGLEGGLEPVTLLFLRFGFALPVYLAILV